MSLNIEIKARVLDFGEMRRRAAALSGQLGEQLDQVDVFFPVPRGRLKLRILRPDRGELIFYQRPNDPGPKKSDYFVAATGQPARLRDILGRAYGTRGVVRKRRLVYRVGSTRIHLDDVEGLGRFVELEVALDDDNGEARGKEIAADLMLKLGIDRGELVAGAYIDLLEQSAAVQTSPERASGESGETRMSGVSRINHVAVVVKDLESALKFWRDDMGLSLAAQHDVPAEESRVAYLATGNARIELVEPLNADSGVARFLSTRGPGMHHICIEVENLDAVAARLRARGVRLINEIPRPGTDGTRYLFVHPESTGGVLLELYELP